MTLKVFISYSHDPDDQKHGEFVLSLSEQLRSDGIDCNIDQYLNGSPSEGWQRWMERHIEEANFVLIICTPIYLKRFKGEDHSGGVGRGVNFEGAIISQVLYDHFQQNVKFIPIIPESGSSDDIPLMLKKSSFYRLENDLKDGKDYVKLYRVLTGQPLIKAGKLGRLKKHPPISRNAPLSPEILSSFNAVRTEENTTASNKKKADEASKATDENTKITKKNSVIGMIGIVVGIIAIVITIVGIVVTFMPINNSEKVKDHGLTNESKMSYIDVCVLKNKQDQIKIKALNRFNDDTNQCYYETDVEKSCCQITNLSGVDQVTEIQVEISRNNVFFKVERVNLGMKREFSLRN